MLVKSKSFSTAVQRASMAVINAVKLLPFNSPAKDSSSSGREGFLSRRFSRKLFRRSLFWKSKDKSSDTVTTTTQYDRTRKKWTSNEELVEDDEIERWISSGVVGKEKYEPLDLSNDTTVTKFSTTSVSNSDGKSDDNSSWGDDITFTSDSSTENDVVEGEENLQDLAISDGVGEESVKPVVNEVSLWHIEETEKEQSRPIFVLDIPYNKEGNLSPFTTTRTLHLEGIQERLLKRLGKFEYLTGLELVNLESVISSIEIEDPSSPKYSIQPCATPSYILSCVSEEEESTESEVEKRAQHLLNIIKFNIPTKNFELENVMLDFFRENVTYKTNDTLLNMAKNWLNEHYDTCILEWEVKDKRQAYIRDMEEGGWWPRDIILEREEVSSELGDEVLVHLIEELIVEFCT